MLPSSLLAFMLPSSPAPPPQRQGSRRQGEGPTCLTILYHCRGIPSPERYLASLCTTLNGVGQRSQTGWRHAGDYFFKRQSRFETTRTGLWLTSGGCTFESRCRCVTAAGGGKKDKSKEKKEKEMGVCKWWLWDAIMCCPCPSPVFFSCITFPWLWIWLLRCKNTVVS